ncbi:uncharacterized protein LOC117292270 [Asterias rubens]|uniref:uncharacterized protein LOC117292270 n=1 Tax=Asterias rubens TaxID=7604 RepID=UPI0014559110|nr:uncharacterized protein LOC117292270 [Asterias rubens]
MESFDRVEQLIADVNQCIETSQSLCERVCKDLRPLLHQPWPPKEKPSPKPSPQTDSSVGDHGDAVSLEDAETLAKVELALVRAQKARDLQRKLNPVVELHKEDKTTSEPEEENPPKSQTIDGQEFAVISQSDLQKLFRDDALKLSEKKANTSATKPRLGPAQARAAYSAKVPRPSTKSRYTTSSSDIGKHKNKLKATSADGKNANSKMKPVSEKDAVRQRSANVGISNNRIKKQLNVRNENELVNVDTTLAEEPKTGNLRSAAKHNRTAVNTTVQENQPRMREKVKQSSVNFSNKSRHEREVHTQSTNGSENLARKMAKLKLTDEGPSKPLVMGVTKDETSGLEEQSKPFMLKWNGSDLKVSGKIKKSYSVIAKLRSKLSSEVDSVKESSPSQYFLHRMESKFQPSPTSLSFREVQERIENLTTECRHVLQVVKTALLQNQRQSEEPSLESRYTVKLFAETLRKRLEDLTVEIQNVVAAEEQLLSSQHRRVPSSKSSTPFHEGLQQWEISTPSISIFLPVKQFQGSVSQIRSGQDNCRNIEYCTLRELQTFSTLQHDVQRLALQIQIEKLIGAEILPIIEVLNPSDTNFVPFYRSVFGLLCHCGQLYPSVITDNVGNTSEADVT